MPLPRLPIYWESNDDSYIVLLTNCMRCNSFEEILGSFLVTDNSLPSADKGSHTVSCHNTIIMTIMVISNLSMARLSNFDAKP